MKSMKRLYSTGIFLLSLLVLACHAQDKSSQKEKLEVSEFAAGLKQDSIQLLDVRTPGEYASGHLKGSLWADWNDQDEFNRRTSYLNKNKPVYVYCLSGARSAAAAAQFRKNGYQQVYELKGGINAWKQAGLPVEGMVNEKQMSISDFEAAIQSSPLVLVDFGADWCPPCKKLEPILKTITAKYSDKLKMVKVDGGRDQDLLKKYNVEALPVVLIFKNGQQVWRKDGIAEEKEIEAQLQ
jgi:thioredoxin